MSFTENKVDEEAEEYEDSSESEEKEVEEEVDLEEIGLSNRAAKFVFFYFLSLLILFNVDHGAVPAALTEIQDELGYSKTQLGTMGSLVFLGIVIGSVTAAFFLDRFPIKRVIMLAIIGNGFGMLLFIYFKEFHYVCFARFVSGFCQIVAFIYGPLFVDAYFPVSSRSFWLAIIVISAPVGTCIGFAFTGSMLAL